MNVYLAISKTNRPNVDVEAIRSVLSEFAIELVVFIDMYNYKAGQEKEMMNTAFIEIQSSDFLIAEVSKKAIGVGIEIGYAFALKKPIIYLRRADTNYSTTVSGCAAYQISYTDLKHLRSELTTIVAKIIQEIKSGR